MNIDMYIGQDLKINTAVKYIYIYFFYLGQDLLTLIILETFHPNYDLCKKEITTKDEKLNEICIQL